MWGCSGEARAAPLPLLRRLEAVLADLDPQGRHFPLGIRLARGGIVPARSYAEANGLKVGDRVVIDVPKGTTEALLIKFGAPPAKKGS